MPSLRHGDGVAHASLARAATLIVGVVLLGRCLRLVVVVILVGIVVLLGVRTVRKDSVSGPSCISKIGSGAVNSGGSILGVITATVLGLKIGLVEFDTPLVLPAAAVAAPESRELDCVGLGFTLKGCIDPPGKAAAALGASLAVLVSRRHCCELGLCQCCLSILIRSSPCRHRENQIQYVPRTWWMRMKSYVGCGRMWTQQDFVVFRTAQIRRLAGGLWSGVETLRVMLYAVAAGVAQLCLAGSQAKKPRSPSPELVFVASTAEGSGIHRR